MANKEDVQIMVVPREKLFSEKQFQGFLHHNETDFNSKILENFEWMRRGDAEINPEFQQPIAYCIIVNKNTKKIFAYQRTEKAGESRLHNKWSWGVGGHIDVPDHDETKSENPIELSMMRELEEEIGLKKEQITKITPLGYINDDSNSVGKVHFGILYSIETNLKNIEQAEEELSKGKMFSIEELESIKNNPDNYIESWSQISFDPLKKYLNP